MEALELRSLTKHYGSCKAVDGLCLTVHPGEVFALLGQNGAGKTTTIKMLCGQLRPTSGDAFVFGHSVTAELQSVKHLVGVSPQETAIAPKLSVRENLELMARLYGVPDARTRAGQMLERFQLTDCARARSRTLSGGMQRRLSIAMAMISEPQVLFLDEPTLGLDVRARRDLWRHIVQIRQHCTVILTTHYLEEVEALADRAAILSAGTLKTIGTIDEIRAQTGCKTLEDAFLRLTEGESEA